MLVLLATAAVSTSALVLTTWTRGTAATSATLAHVAQAHAAAEAGIARLIHAMRASDDPLRRQLQQGGGSTLWTFADAQVKLLMEPESGKVDLNTGDPDLIVAFLNATLPDSPLRSRLEAMVRHSDRTRNPLPSVMSVLTPCERLRREAKKLEQTFTVLTHSKGVGAHSANPSRLAHVPLMTAQDIDMIKRLLQSGRSPMGDWRLTHVRRYLAAEVPVYSLRASAVTSGIRRDRVAVIALLSRRPYVRLVSLHQPTQPADISCADD